MKKLIILCTSIIVLVTLGFMTAYFLISTENISYDKSLLNMDMVVNSTQDFNIIINDAENDTNQDNFSINYSNELISVENKDNKPEIKDGNVRGQKIATYTFKANKAGSTDVKITFNSASGTSEIPLVINVTDGSENYPFVIKNETQLRSIGSGSYKLDGNYVLSNNIILEGEWTPIAGEFVGTFNGNGNSILNMKYNNEQNILEYFGLFEQIGTTGKVYNLNISNVAVNGKFNNAGVIAGVNKGEIYNLSVSSTLLNNEVDNKNSYTGGIVGKNISEDAGLYGKIVSTSFDGELTVNKGQLGGISGANVGATIGYTYTNANTKLNALSTPFNIGGISGTNIYSNRNALVAESYSLASTSTTIILEDTESKLGGVVANHEFVASSKENKSYGCYYLSGAGFDRAFAGYEDKGTVSNSSEVRNGIYTSQGYDMNSLRNRENFTSYYDFATKKIMWNFETIWNDPTEIATPTLKTVTAIQFPTEYNLIRPNTITNIDDLLGKTDVLNSHDKFEILSDINGNGAIIENGIDLTNKTLTGNKENGENVVISNFTIAITDDTTGFFNSLSNSKLENITFKPNKVVLSETLKISDIYNIGIIAGKSISSSLNNVIVDFGNAEFVFNLVLSNQFKDKTLNLGSAFGYSKSSTLSSCKVLGNEKSISIQSGAEAINRIANIGGLIGQTEESEIKDSQVNNLTLKDGDSYAGVTGGIVGEINTTTINPTLQNCTADNIRIENPVVTRLPADGSVKGHYSGGLVGLIDINAYQNGRITISHSTANANIKGHVVGGLVGSTYGNITTSTANTVSTGWKVGGIAGYQRNYSIISNCLITGTLTQSSELASYEIANPGNDKLSYNSNAPEVAGISAVSLGASDAIPEMRNCFVNCKMEGSNVYGDTASMKYLNKIKNFLGFEQNLRSNYPYTGKTFSCVINSSLTSNIKERPGKTSDRLLRFEYINSSIDSYSSNDSFSSFDKNLWDINQTETKLK